MSPAVLSYSAAGQLDQCSFSYSCSGVAWISFKVVIFKFINYFMLLEKRPKKKKKNPQQLCKSIRFGYNLHPRRRHWLEAGGLLVWPHWQCLPVHWEIMLFSPQLFMTGGISRTACSHIIPGDFRPLFISPFSVTTSHPLPHLPLEHEHPSFQATKSFSLPLSWASSVKHTCFKCFLLCRCL